MEANKQVKFRKMFPDSWHKLKRQGAELRCLPSAREGFQVTTGWQRNRFVKPLFDRIFSHRDKHYREQPVGQTLYKAYVHQFEQQRHSYSQPANSPLANRNIHWSPSENHHNRPTSELDSRQNLHVAMALQLGGVVKIREKDGVLHQEPTAKSVTAKRIEVIDRCVNSDPVRLAYEYIATGRQKVMPDRFIPQLLIPHLCGKLVALTGLGLEDAEHVIQTLLNAHHIRKPQDLDLANLMEVKNAIRRLGNEHKRVVSTIQGQRYINRAKRRHAGTHRSIHLSRRTGSLVQPERLLADAGGTVDSAREHFIEQLRAAGFPLQDATRQIDQLFKQHQMKGEQDFTLTRFLLLADAVSGLTIARNRKTASGKERSQTSAMEYIGRLRHRNTMRAGVIPVRSLKSSRTSHSSHKSKPPQQQSHYSLKRNDNGQWKVQGQPTLVAPESQPDFICDKDDEWLIQQQVDNGHLTRLFKDFALRALRWCERNKRIMGVQAGSLALLALVYGVQSGGISVVIMGATYVISTLAWFGVGTVVERIQQFRKATQLKKAQKVRAGKAGGDLNNDEVEDYLDSYSWFTRHSGLTNTLNAFKNLQRDVNTLSKKPPTSAAELAKYRRIQVLTQLRSQQLGKAFSSLDNLLVEAVQEVSSLDKHFADNFETLWKPFEAMDNRTRMAIFNHAANAKGLKKHWYLPKQDYTRWAKDTLTHRIGDIDHIAIFLDEKLNLDQPLSLQELDVKKSSAQLNEHLKRGVQLAGEGAKAGVSYVTSTLRSTLWRHVESSITKVTTGANPTLAGLLPIPSSVGVLFWAYGFTATMATESINKLLNRRSMKKYKQKHQQDRFDAGLTDETARADYNKTLLAMRREAKNNIKEFVSTIQELRKEKKKINEELAEHLSQTALLTQEQLVYRARLILRHKMLEAKVYESMHGAIGHMHNETVKAASWLQDAASRTPVE
ncbi:hypothetical protein [Sansalvadorimonas verongulae]|uniref:hypothetical protein n=1 Tax=Sansalvadorimonas verongulae TaxID=2172824 RepID=UPI0012BC2EEC|nr:hypothetical protein [Sansalvadorimonas verongulae]MTI14500.1 hypothetical protein [Sansalvadorimonas verongulae]